MSSSDTDGLLECNLRGLARAIMEWDELECNSLSAVILNYQLMLRAREIYGRKNILCGLEFSCTVLIIYFKMNLFHDKHGIKHTVFSF